MSMDDRDKPSKREDSPFLYTFGSIMSRKNPSSIAPSLSPSAESRFVPLSPAAEAPGSGHAKRAASENSPAQKENSTSVDESPITATQEPKRESTLVVDDEKSGIVGATICFTPNPSPRSSPNISKLDSPNSDGNGRISSANMDDSGDGGMKGASSKMSSSAMLVASSLDGRSTTEYEILDGISSKATLEVEDLILDGEDEEECAGVEGGVQGAEESEGRSNRVHDDMASSLATLSPCNTLLSLTDTPLRMFKTPHPNEKNPIHQVPDEVRPVTPTRPKPAKAGLRGPSNSPLEVPKTPHPDQKTLPRVPDEGCPPTLMRRASLKKDFNPNNPDIISVDEHPKDADPSVTSHKDDEGLEGRPVFTHVTKTTVGRIPRHETPQGVDLDSKEEANPDESAVDGPTEVKTAAPADSIKLFSSDVSMQTPGASESGGTGRQSQGSEDNALVVPKTETFTWSFTKVARSILSFIVSTIVLIRILLRGHISYFIGTLKAMLGKILIRKVAGVMITQDAIGAPEKEAGEAGVSSDDRSDPRLDLSELFSVEAVGQERLDANKSNESDDNNGAALDHKEKAPLKSSDGMVAAGIIRKDKKAPPGPRAITVGYAITSCALICGTAMHTCMLRNGIEVFHGSDFDVAFDVPNVDVPNVDSEDIFAQGVEFQEEAVQDIRCFSNSITSFASVPFWEFNLSPTMYEDLEEELLKEEAPGEVASRLSALVILSAVISLFCAVIFTPEFPSPWTKPQSKRQPLTGIWTEEEHDQFLRGYEVHGSSWKLVSAFVPTRTPTQVKSHGSYWLKMRSPLKMKKTRKGSPTSKETPKASGKKAPKSPSSASSTRSTPRRSNKAKLSPVKGILLEKDHNKLYKNVTPRSEVRTRRMMKMDGSKSDPIKKSATKRRVRIQSP